MTSDFTLHLGTIISIVFAAGIFYAKTSAQQGLIVALSKRIEMLESTGDKLAVIETKLEIMQRDMDRVQLKLDRVIEGAK